MSEGPYDFARERFEAAVEDTRGYKRIGGQPVDENDVPDEEDL